MRNNVKALFFLTISTLLILLCAVPGFVKINLSASVIGYQRSVLIITAYLTLNSLIFYFCACKKGWLGLGGVILALGGEFGVLYVLFPNQESGQWFSNFFRIIGQELNNLSHFNFVVIPQELATFIALSLVNLTLWLSIYHQVWYLSFPLILVYLLSLSVFDSHNYLKPAILAMTIFGIEVFAVSNESILKVSIKISLKLWLLAGVILLISVGIGTVFQQYFVQMAHVIDMPGIKVRNRLNTLGFYQSLNNQSLGVNYTGRKSGFSLDSRELGGPVLDNQQLIYQIWEKQPNYLRLDVKHDYTGRGFSDQVELGKSLKQNTMMLNDLNLAQSPSSSTLKIIFADNLKNLKNQLIPQIYGKTEFKFKEQKINSLTYNPENSLLQYNNSQDQVNQLVFQVRNYIFSSAKLQEAKLSEIPLTVKEKNTKLPKRLPSRIKNLAKKLTRNQESQLNKVLAIEKYLKTNPRFTYTRLDAPHTPKGHDFVDYFLFESPEGYCDHFAAAMLVLLRALNIPTRYAEGYAPGNYKQKIGELNGYEIRSNNAHSWPEVYFANIGWVPFEPTPGFKHYAGNLKSPIISETIPQSSSTSSKVNQSSRNDQKFTSKASTASSKKVSLKKHKLKAKNYPKKAKTKAKQESNWQKILIGSFLALGLMLGFWQRRGLRWLFYLVLLKLGVNPCQIYSLILNQVERQLPRQKSLPLKVYATKVFKYFPEWGEQFIVLTQNYEIQVYGKQVSDQRFKQQIEQLLQKLIKYANKKAVS